jgi:adenylate kinase family enzyme
MKAVIIGNSGSGKSWLAQRLAFVNNAEVIHLDDIYWAPGGFNAKREVAQVEALVREGMAHSSYIAEGVFGALAEKFLAQATVLFWLDLPWSVCEHRLRQRGSESKRHMDREQSEAGLSELLTWASTYHERTDMQSHAAHSKLFERYGGERFRLSSERSVNDYLTD